MMSSVHVDSKELPSTPSTPVRHDGRWASADINGTQSNAARARKEFKIKRKKESSHEIKNFQMPQTWAQRSQATKDRKNANVVSFSYLKFAFYLIISCFLINSLSLFVIANFHASQKIAQREKYAAGLRADVVELLGA
jgi:hypothetical protein